MAKITSVKAEYGVSMEIRGVWHKVLFAMEVQPEKADNVDDVKKKLWNTVEIEIEKQINEIIEAR